jgi:hypothetical protein
MKQAILVTALLICGLFACAQNTLAGVVTDAGDHKPRAVCQHRGNPYTQWHRFKCRGCIQYDAGQQSDR